MVKLWQKCIELIFMGHDIIRLILADLVRSFVTIALVVARLRLVVNLWSV